MTEMSRDRLTALPKSVQERLEELKLSLEKILGDGLTSMVVFGSAVRGGYREGRSDVDLVLVLKAPGRAVLDSIGNALQLARFAARIEAIVLAEDEIPRAADVFPLLYDDIRECHILLSGRDVFSGLTISNEHRRLRIEQELREAQMRLRRMVTDSLGATDALAAAVIRKARQVRSPLQALLVLRGEGTDGSYEAVTRAAGKAYGVEVEAIFHARERAGEAHAALTQLLAAAIDNVDKME